MIQTNDWVDRTLAAAVGIAAFVFMCVWPFEGLHPYVWNDAAVAAGALPPTAILPGFGNSIGHILYTCLPFAAAEKLYLLAARFIVACSGVMACGIFAGLMRLVSGAGARDFARRTWAIRLASTVAGAVFVFSDPLWHAAQGLGGNTIVLFLSVLSIYLLVRLLETARESRAIAALCAVGLLAAETPLGWIVLALDIAAILLYAHFVTTPAWDEFLDPIRMQRTKWLMTFVFLGAFGAGLFVETVQFVRLGGLHATGISMGELPSTLIAAYFGRLVDSMNLPGLFGLLIVIFVPLALTSALILVSTDEDCYLSVKCLLVYIVSAGIAFLQLSPFAVTWYWSFIPGVKVAPATILLSALLSSLTLAWALFVLGVELLCRNYRHVETMLYQAEMEDEEKSFDPAAPVTESVHLSVARILALLLPLILVLIVVCGRRLPNDRALNRVISTFVREVLDEMGQTKYLFTDGSYDAPLRYEAKRRGKEIAPVSLMGTASAVDTFLRTYGTENEEDRMTLETGAAEALRTWVLAKSERLGELSVQLAFEIFGLNRRLRPIVYGALVRPVGGDEKDAQASVERCHRLADEIVTLHESGRWRHASDEKLKDLFLFSQFRLAVMSRLRAIRLDAERKTAESMAEIAYSDRLNANNPSLVKILRKLDWVKRQTGEALTPREGLDVALKRADFVMARRYAMPVLREDPDEPNANFAVGMSYYAEEQFAKAEQYLLRVFKKAPDAPAVHNNLALLYLKTGRLVEAEKHATKALEGLPDSAEVKDTIRQIEKAKADRNSGRNPLSK